MTAFIGNQQPVYHVAPGENALPVIKQALTDGERDLILTDGNYTLGASDSNDGINLDDFTTNKTLRLFWAGPHIGGITRGKAGFPLFRGGDGWTIVINGLHFQEGTQAGSVHDPHNPLCRFTNFDLFEALNAAWHTSHGGGLVLEITNSARAGNVKLNTARFDLNRAFGLDMIDVGEIEMLGCHVQNNKYDAQGQDVAIPGVLVRGNFRSPTGLIRNIHAEAAAINGNWCLDVQRADNLRVLDCYLWLSNVRFGAGVTNSLIENTALFDSTITEGGTGNTYAYNTPDIREGNTQNCPEV